MIYLFRSHVDQSICQWNPIAFNSFCQTFLRFLSKIAFDLCYLESSPESRNVEKRKLGFLLFLFQLKEEYSTKICLWMCFHFAWVFRKVKRVVPMAGNLRVRDWTLAPPGNLLPKTTKYSPPYRVHLMINLAIRALKDKKNVNRPSIKSNNFFERKSYLLPYPKTVNTLQYYLWWVFDVLAKKWLVSSYFNKIT